MDTFAPERPIIFGSRRTFGLDLLGTVTYFLRPHIVTPEAHAVGQARAAASARAALDMARAAL